jgi:hypothetical protein
MDLKVLFHNPHDLTDQELYQLRKKIKRQYTMPYTAALFGGFGAYLFDNVYLRKSHSWARVGTGALLGFAIGAYSSYQVASSVERKFDSEIINAFDKKYLDTVLNATGFGSNYLSVKDYSETQTLKKPY